MKLKLQRELIKLPAELINNNNITLIESYKELSGLLNYINKDDQKLFFYLNRIKIQALLLDEDQIIKINNENINYNGLKSLFYLSLAIKNDRFVINYSYDSFFINDLYNSIKEEKNKLKKLLLYILFDIFFDNYKQFNSTNDSNTSDIIDKTTDEIKIFLNQQLSVLNEFDLFLHKKEDDLIDIENIYSGIIIWLIKNRKFDNYKYVEDIMKQLDLGNIELTSNIFKELKKEFDENSKEEYIDNYKIKNFESLNNENIINFNFLLFKYVFKISIYIYNIDFLLESKKAIYNLLKKDYDRIQKLITPNKHESNQNFDERKAFIIKRFIDLDYYILGDELKKLYEVLEYYKHFYFENKDEIKEIEDTIQKKVKKNIKKYLDLYDKAKKMNIRYELLKYIYDGNIKDKKYTQDSFLENIVKPWEDHIENFIHEKKLNFQKYGKYKKMFKLVFNFFSNIDNKKSILKIFTEEEVDIFMKNYNDYHNLMIVKTYFNNFLFESKKEDIEAINSSFKDIINNNLDEYLKYLHEAKQLKSQYKFLKEIFNIGNKKITEDEMNNILKKWERIKNMLEERKFDLEDEDIKKRLFIYFNKEENQKKHRKILNEESYNFLLEKKEEALKEILNYYKLFFPETKKKSIELIKSGKIEEEDLKDYPNAKIRNVRKPLIFSLIDEKIEKTDKEISLAIEKWEKIESDIKKKQFDNIDKIDRIKIINFFKNKDNPENKFITQIFSNEIIEAFVVNENLNEKQDKKPDLSLKKENSSSRDLKESKKNKNFLENINKNESKFHKITMLLCFKNKNLIIEKLWKNDILYQKDKFNLLKNEPKMKNIFDYIKKIEEILIQNYASKSQQILKLMIEEKAQKNFYKYEFLDFKEYSKGNISFLAFEEEQPSDNSVSVEFKKFLSEKINNNDIGNKNNKKNRKIANKILEKRKNEELSEKIKKNQNRDNMIEQAEKNKIEQINENNGNDITLPPKKNDDDSSKVGDKFKVLELLDIIGNHNDKNRMYTPEFINEINDSFFLSSGTNNDIKIYNKDFKEEKGMIKNEIKEWVYSIYEREKNNDQKKKAFIACANKEIYLFTFNGTQFEENKKWNIPNMTCLSCAEVNIKEMIKSSKRKNRKQKEVKEQNTEYLIIAGRNGVKYIIDVFGDKNKIDLNSDLNNYYIVRDYTFRSVFKLSETRIAFTSNAIIPEGINKLIIYNFNKNENKNNDNSKKRGKIEYETKETENEDRYSFIASNNGMECLNENVLLCACKKYTKKDKNGILLVLLNNEEDIKVKKIFFDTKDFEVYCFCAISEWKKEGRQIVNDPTNFTQKTDYFFVGGFDNKLREGKIKLFKYERVNKDEVTNIKFLQDIEFEEKDEYFTDANKEKSKKFEGFFSGAINSIIQHKNTWNFLASCYDGKIYLLSKPNLISYGVVLNN